MLTGEDGEGSLVAGVAKGDASAGGELEGVHLLLRDVEGDGHGEESTIGETKGRHDAVGDDDEGDKKVSFALMSSFSAWSTKTLAVPLWTHLS